MDGRVNACVLYVRFWSPRSRAHSSVLFCRARLCAPHPLDRPLRSAPVRKVSGASTEAIVRLAAGRRSVRTFLSIAARRAREKEYERRGVERSGGESGTRTLYGEQFKFAAVGQRPPAAPRVVRTSVAPRRVASASARKVRSTREASSSRGQAECDCINYAAAATAREAECERRITVHASAVQTLQYGCR